MHIVKRACSGALMHCTNGSEIIMIDAAAAGRAYLRFVLRETKESPSAIAKKAGISSTTLTRPLNDPDHKFSISTTTIGKIHRVTGISPAPFFEGADIAEVHAAYMHGDQYDPAQWTTTPGELQATIVIGDVAAGQWKEMDIADVSKYPPILLCSSNHPPAACFGVVVRGTSINKVAEDGDVLFCVRFSESSFAPNHNDLVVVERTSEDGALIELSAKRLKRAGTAWELWPESTDPKFQQPLPLAGLDPTSTIRLLGDVLYVIKYPR